MKLYDINKKRKFEIELTRGEISHMMWYIQEMNDHEYKQNTSLDNIMEKLFQNYREQLEKEREAVSEPIHDTDKSN